MMRFLLLIACLSSLSVFSVQLKSTQTRLSRRKYNEYLKTSRAEYYIYGGRPADDGEFPWMVSFRIRTATSAHHLCGGALIAKEWVLTAAHCIEDWMRPFWFEVIAGHQNSLVQSFYRHQQFHNSSYEYDIALLKLATPITIDGFLTNTLCLPEPYVQYRENCSVCGWGFTSSENSVQSHLQTVELPIIPIENCIPLTVEVNRSNLICAGDASRDSCSFDSGGPLVCRNNDSTYCATGIVSAGFGSSLLSSCSPGPGVYTAVSSFRSWIDETIKLNS